MFAFDTDYGGYNLEIAERFHISRYLKFPTFCRSVLMHLHPISSDCVLLLAMWMRDNRYILCEKAILSVLITEQSSSVAALKLFHSSAKKEARVFYHIDVSYTGEILKHISINKEVLDFLKSENNHTNNYNNIGARIPQILGVAVNKGSVALLDGIWILNYFKMCKKDLIWYVKAVRYLFGAVEKGLIDFVLGILVDLVLHDQPNYINTFKQRTTT